MNDTMPTLPANEQAGQELKRDLGASPPGFWAAFRSRLIGGLLLALPVLLTAYVIYQVYALANFYVLNYLAPLVAPQVDSVAELPPWVRNIIVPLVSILTVVLVLYILGYIAQTRLSRFLDWVLERFPGVSSIYGVLKNVFASMKTQGGLKKVDRVVLVKVPTEQSRIAGYVTATLRDHATSEVILGVYIPVALFPPSGYTLMVPEREVVDTDWKVSNVLEIMLSGGSSLPTQVPYSGKPDRTLA